ncbi:MAG: hypothetical protein RJA35_1272 [Actinomycetota bacterium]
MEFVFVFPLMLAMIFFMLDAGRFMAVQFVLNNAAEVGAREVAISADPSMASSQARATVAKALVHLSTLNGSISSLGIVTAEYLCPLGSENYETVNAFTGATEPAPDGNCIDLGLPQYSAYSCAVAPANYRAFSRVELSFKWLTPLRLLANIAEPDEFGPSASSYFNRNDQDTTIIEGKAKLLCQN